MGHRPRGLAVLIALTLALLPAAAAGADPGDGHADRVPDLVRAATVGAASITAGRSHSCAITSLGAVYCWGSNAHGQLGDGSLTSSPTAVQSTGPLADLIAVQVDAGAAHTCAIDTFGLAYCWGENTAGQLGTGDPIEQDKPSRVEALSDRTLVEITTGEDHSCAIDEDGTAWCWGDDTHGQLGAPGLTGSSATPVQVSTQSGMTDPVVDIAAGGDTTCAATATGKAYCWGQGDHGEVGDGDGVDRAEPVEVSTGGTVRQVAVGEARSCAVDASAAAFCWGEDLGVTPVEVAGGVRFSEVSAGGGHFCGLDKQQNAHCWGSNTNGEVGDGSATDRPDPVELALGARDAASDLRDIEAGDKHSCALDESGTAYCWGADDEGQLGNGGSGASSVPVRVQGLPRPPTAVTGLTVTAIDGGLRASWSPAADFGTGTFGSYLALTSNYESRCEVTEVDGTGCDLKGLQGGHTYDVAVLTLTDKGSALSSFATGTPILPTPSPSPSVSPKPAPGEDPQAPDELPITGPAPLLSTGVLLAAIGGLLLFTASEPRPARRRGRHRRPA